MPLPNVVILAISAEGGASVFEPEQDHSCDEESDELCDCPVEGFDRVVMKIVTTQVEREEIIAQAIETAGGGLHTCDDSEEAEDCDCDLSPAIPVWVVVEGYAGLAGHPDGFKLAETWGRWLGALEVSFDPVAPPQVSFAPPDWRAVVAGRADASNEELRNVLALVPMVDALTVCEGLAKWVQWTVTRAPTAE